MVIAVAKRHQPMSLTGRPRQPIMRLDGVRFHNACGLAHFSRSPHCACSNVGKTIGTGSWIFDATGLISAIRP
jgi:hypothetical protein